MFDSVLHIPDYLNSFFPGLNGAVHGDFFEIIALNNVHDFAAGAGAGMTATGRGPEATADARAIQARRGGNQLIA